MNSVYHSWKKDFRSPPVQLPPTLSMNNIRPLITPPTSQQLPRAQSTALLEGSKAQRSSLS